MFLENPERIAEAYGFRLTKGDHEILTPVFTNLGAEDMKNLVKAFEALENEVYKRLGQPETLAAVPLDCSRAAAKEVHEAMRLVDLAASCNSRRTKRARPATRRLKESEARQNCEPPPA